MSHETEVFVHLASLVHQVLVSLVTLVLIGITDVIDVIDGIILQVVGVFIDINVIVVPVNAVALFVGITK